VPVTQCYSAESVKLLCLATKTDILITTKTTAWRILVIVGSVGLFLCIFYDWPHSTDSFTKPTHKTTQSGLVAVFSSL